MTQKKKKPRLSIRERKKASRILVEQRHQILPSGHRIRLSTSELELLMKNERRLGVQRMRELERNKKKKRKSLEDTWGI